MLGALAGLPQLGGLGGGGFGGGSLPMLGFGLLSALTSQLTTSSFMGTPTSIPSFSSTDLGMGNVSNSFGSYTGNNGNVGLGSSAIYGDPAYMHTQPADFNAWHQWATGGTQPPLQVASYGNYASGQAYGTAGSYGSAGYGAAGSYGMAGSYQAYGGAPSYGCQPPIFSSAHQAYGAQAYGQVSANYVPAQNYLPQPTYASQSMSYGATANYVSQQNYAPQPAYAQLSYGCQSPMGNGQFNAWANDALAQFNAQSSQATYQSSQGYAGQSVQAYTLPPAQCQQQIFWPQPGGYPQPSYGTVLPQGANGNPQFDAWANDALARFNAQNAQFQASYQPSQPQPVYGSQPAYGAPPQAYAQSSSFDLAARISTFQQLPAYQSYQSNYQSLSSGSSASYGAYNLGWNCPAQPAPYYNQAFSSYAGQVMQGQTSYGYGGPPQPAPCPPPHHHHPRPQPPLPTPEPPVAVVPPRADPPPVVQPTVVTPPTTPPPRVEYPRVPVDGDFDNDAKVLGSRMTGDPSKIATLTSTNPAPINNQDASRFDRIGAYFVMQQDTSLRYNVDNGHFFRTFADGSSKDVLDMAQVSQMLRQEHPDHFGRVGQLLNHLPNDKQLFGQTSPPGVATTGPSTFVHGAIPINPGFLPPLQMPVLPPQQPVVLPTFGGIPNSGGKNPALDQVLADRNAGRLTGNDFNAELIRIAAQTGAINPNPQQAHTALAPFTITAHRYWDTTTGAYADVSEVMIQGGESPNDIERMYNPNKQTSLNITKNDVPLGNPMRVTVSWDNGQSRVWDYQIQDTKGSEVDVFSPLG